MTQLTVRRLNVDLKSPLDRHWCGGDAFRTALFNALSFSFPAGEQFFIDAVRAGLKALPEEKRQAMKAQYPDAEHPVVRTHPDTGEKILFVNAFATHFVNFHTKDKVRIGQDYNQCAGDLLQYLISQAYIPEYQVRWRWAPFSVAIWDNRSTQHYAVMDYPPCHRKMERAGIVGTRPY